MSEAAAEPGRRERKKAALRDSLIESAAALFEEQGVEATTVAHICERADVAQKTFFNHFPSKAHLMRAIAGSAMDRFLADVETASKRPGTTRERIDWLFGHIASQAAEAGPMHRELLNEFIHLGQQQGSSETRRLHTAFGALLREGRLAGDVTEAHAEETLVELVLGAFYTLMFDFTHLEAHPVRERAAALARLLGDAVTGAPEETRS